MIPDNSRFDSTEAALDLFRKVELRFSANSTAQLSLVENNRVAIAFLHSLN